MERRLRDLKLLCAYSTEASQFHGEESKKKTMDYELQEVIKIFSLYRYNFLKICEIIVLMGNLFLICFVLCYLLE